MLAREPDKRSARVLRDEQLSHEVQRVWEESDCNYGARKIYKQLERERIRVARCTVERLMKKLGIKGVRRGKPKDVIHHSDRGSQYLSICYTDRLTEAGFNASVGSVGDSYDNALAETINGLYKTEVIHKNGPWRSLDDVEKATLTGVEWFNNRRLLRPIGDLPPAEYEMRYYQQIESSNAA